MPNQETVKAWALAMALFSLVLIPVAAVISLLVFDSMWLFNYWSALLMLVLFLGIGFSGSSTHKRRKGRRQSN